MNVALILNVEFIKKKLNYILSISSYIVLREMSYALLAHNNKFERGFNHDTIVSFNKMLFEMSPENGTHFVRTSNVKLATLPSLQHCSQNVHMECGLRFCQQTYSSSKAMFLL